MRALSFLSTRTGLSSMGDLTTSGADMPLVMFPAGATTLVLPITTEGLIIPMKEQFAMNSFGNGLVYAVPGDGGLAFDDSVREAPQANDTDREHVSAHT